MKIPESISEIDKRLSAILKEASHESERHSLAMVHALCEIAYQLSRIADKSGVMIVETRDSL